MRSRFVLATLLATTLTSLVPVTTPAQDPAPGRAVATRWQLPATDDGLPGAGPLRQADWFRKLWSERRGGWSKRADADRNAVVMLGDSITQGWGDDFSGAFPGVKVANRGISGDTSRGVLIRLAEDVLALEPRAVVLLIGTNDLEEQADPETIAGNVRLILAELKKGRPGMPVVLCEVFPSSESKKRPSAKIKKLNQLFAGIVKTEPQVTLIETWKLFADPAGDAKPGEFPDLLHLNRLGYAKWAAALRPVFATLDLLETEPYQFTPEPGFVSLFNGRDLSGWTTKPPTVPGLEGRVSTPDGRYVAKNGRLIVTTPPEGHRIQQLWTTRQFSNDFVLRLEFRATPNADSGIFVRGNQLQCRDYPLAGPYKQLRNYRSGDWNEVEITVRGGTAFSLCNGEVLEAAQKVPAVGPVGLEGDCGQMEYRRLRVRELP